MSCDRLPVLNGNCHRPNNKYSSIVIADVVRFENNKKYIYELVAQLRVFSFSRHIIHAHTKRICHFSG